MCMHSYNTVYFQEYACIRVCRGMGVCVHMLVYMCIRVYICMQVSHSGSIREYVCLYNIYGIIIYLVYRESMHIWHIYIQRTCLLEWRPDFLLGR